MDMLHTVDHLTAENAKLSARIAELEAEVERLVEALRRLRAAAAPNGLVFKPCQPEPDTGPDPDYFDDDDTAFPPPPDPEPASTAHESDDLADSSTNHQRDPEATP